MSKSIRIPNRSAQATFVIAACLVAISLAVVSLVAPTADAATKPGARCSTAGATSSTKSGQLVCTAVKGELRWKRVNASTTSNSTGLLSLPLPATASIGVIGAQYCVGGRSFIPYGFECDRTGDGAAGAGFRNPQPTFYAPLGTQVLAPVTGTVSAVKKLYSGDYTIMIKNGRSFGEIWETEHVINPVVKAGDRVTAGQHIALVSDYDSRWTPGIGLVELGLLRGGNPPQHLCPFESIAGSKKQEIAAQLAALLAADAARGLISAPMSPIGCIGTAPIEG